MLKDAKLPVEFWVEAAETDAYLRNRTAAGPLINGKPTSPEEAFTGQKPSIDHIRVWGCKVYSYVDPKSLPVGSRHDKLMDRGRVGVFMGYMDETEKHYRLWAPDLRRVIRGHSVRFVEQEKGGDIDLNLKVKPTLNTVPERRPVGRPRKVLFAPEPPAEEEEEAQQPEASEAVTTDESQQEPQPPAAEREEQDRQPDNQDAVPSSAPGTRRFRGVFIPKRKRSPEDSSTDEPEPKVPRSLFALISQTPLECYKEPEAQVFYALSAQLRTIIRPEIPTPKTYKEAVGDPQFGTLWQRAIEDELTALAGNGTWEEAVPPKGVNIVTSKWVFKPKLNTDGSLEKAKARLVARGFTQRFGYDFWDTFAPTVRHETLRTFLAIVGLLDLELY